MLVIRVLAAFPRSMSLMLAPGLAKTQCISPPALRHLLQYDKAAGGKKRQRNDEKYAAVFGSSAPRLYDSVESRVCCCVRFGR